MTEIKGLENLVNLQELRLSNCQISEIKGLETLENLRVLGL
ncbi:MAG: leucine-rich repeat domain-containing protein [Promethearchaeota archaeon]